MNSDGGVDRTLKGRVVAAWRQWRETSRLPINNNGIPLKNKRKNKVVI